MSDIRQRTTGEVTRPTTCSSCLAALSWALPSDYYTICLACSVAATVLVGIARSPRHPLLTADSSIASHVPTATGAPRQQPYWHVTPSSTTHDRPLLATQDFRDCHIAQHRDSTDFVVLSRGPLTVAVQPRAHTAYARHLLLAQWARVAPDMQVNEADIAAHVVASLLLRQQLPEPPPDGFPGQAHVFPSHDTPPDVGACRQATLSDTRYEATDGDPDESAYASVASYGLPMHHQFVNAILTKIRHPLRSLILNGLRYGFSLLSSPPRQLRRDPRRYAYRGPLLHLYNAALQHECDIRALVLVDGWKQRQHPVPVIHAPLYGMMKACGTKLRLVPDMSCGTGSVNSHTRNGALPRPRLATLRRICRRIVYLRLHHPQDDIHIQRVDIKDCYRNFPIQRRQRWANTHVIGSHLFAHTALPFGARSSCAITTTVTTALEDYLASTGVFAPVYVDDFLQISLARDSAAHQEAIVAVLTGAGLPVNRAKLQADGPPASRRQVLGVTICTASMTVSITPERVVTIRNTIGSLLKASSVSAGALRKLSGTLAFVADCLPMARMFTRALRRYAHGHEQLHAIPDDLRVELQYWLDVLLTWNGTAALLPREHASTSHRVTEVHTDASKFGWGYHCPDTNVYASGTWTAAERRQYNVAVAELVAIALAAAALAPTATGGVLLVHTDSASCAHVITTLRAHDPRIFTLMLLLSVLQLRWNFALHAVWIPGSTNNVPDALSRTNRLPATPLPGPPPRRQSAPLRRHNMLLAGGMTLMHGSGTHSPSPLRQNQAVTAVRWRTRLDCTTSTAQTSDICPSPLRLWIL